MKLKSLCPLLKIEFKIWKILVKLTTCFHLVFFSPTKAKQNHKTNNNLKNKTKIKNTNIYKKKSFFV